MFPVFPWPCFTNFNLNPKKKKNSDDSFPVNTVQLYRHPVVDIAVYTLERDVLEFPIINLDGGAPEPWSLPGQKKKKHTELGLSLSLSLSLSRLLFSLFF